MTGGILSYLFSLCCGVFCCLIVLLAIGGGIVFLLKRNKSTEVGEDEVSSEAPEDEVPEDETTHKIDENLSAESVDTTGESEVSESKDASVQEPVVNPKAAGQTIIAFDDDDEDFR